MKAEPLTIEALEVTRGGVSLFSPISLVAHPGSIWAVRGANGSGKSTFLRALAGLHPVASGQVRYGEHPHLRHPDYPAYLHYLGHKRALRPSLSVAQNLRYWAEMAKAPELIPVALRYFDLIPYADTPCEALSAGWQERVCLARLLVYPQAALWLLDEPFTHLDQAAISLLESLIRARCEQGGSVILTTHMNIAPDTANIIHII